MWLKIGAAIALVLAIAFGIKWLEGRGYDRRVGEEATEKVKDMERIRELNRALNVVKANQEVEDVKNAKTVQRLARQLRDAAGPDGRLRDPNAVNSCPGTDSGNGSGAGDGAEAGGLLSVQLSNLLEEKLQEADDINVAYISCRSKGRGDAAITGD